MEEVHQPQSTKSHIPPLLAQTWIYILFALVVVVAPILNFTLIDLLKPEWQDGRFVSYIYLFLLPEASIWFFMLLAYTIISYLLLLLAEERFAVYFFIRFGIYSGMLLALQYSILSFAASVTASPAFLIIPLAYVAPLFVPRIFQWGKPYWTKLFRWNRIVAIAIPVIIIALLIWGFVFVLAIFGMAAPFWSFLIALHASRWLWKHYETKQTFARAFGIFAWLSAYAFALRFNILKMFELYNALPTEPPNCYIATAAAKGHPRFVGSQEVTLANGKSMRVNRQLQRLKALEIALMGVSGSGHRRMRRMYDVFGKWLAKRIQNPILADLAYLILVPIELLSFFVLQSLIPEIQTLTERLYRS
ncbi:MAG: hypothetical protein RIR73_1520 [Chloroflexota bacterium]|jgi:hypothetical protein